MAWWVDVRETRQRMSKRVTDCRGAHEKKDGRMAGQREGEINRHKRIRERETKEEEVKDWLKLLVGSGERWS